MNERDFGDLLNASVVLESVIHRLRRKAAKGDTQAACDVGLLQAAQYLIEIEMGDYEPLEREKERRMNADLEMAITEVCKRDGEA